VQALSAPLRVFRAAWAWRGQRAAAARARNSLAPSRYARLSAICGGTPLMRRLAPVTVLLAAAVGLFSGEPSRFHSWWGCVLLGGFVQGVHERVFPSRPAGRLAGLLRRFRR